MKVWFFFLWTFLIPGVMVAQSTFKIELHAPSFINDSLIFSPPRIRIGLEEIYNFKVQTSKGISDFAARFGFASSAFQVNVKDKNVIQGQFDYPQPVSFQYYDQKEEKAYLSSTFFLDDGNYEITLPAAFDSFEIVLNSPVNIEHSNFKKLISGITDIDKKEAIIGAYIKEHPHSYVALWEIVNDYTLKYYNPVYLENLQLFSDRIKNTELFKILERKLQVEASTMGGKEFPAIQFDGQNTITKADFKKYKLTFIDYWTTTCAPCIKAMPKIVGMYKEYKEKGVNFLTITDEQDAKRMNTAAEVLQKNKVTWKNYFDSKKDFNDKVNANGYPLYFLVDQHGIIVARVLGDLDGVKKIMDENLGKP